MTAITGNILGTARKLVLAPCKAILNRIDPPVLVLLYHRVATLARDPELLAVTPENFRAQLRYLKDNFPVVRFEEEWSGAARPAVCITFDDGYADNFREALPILEEANLPATFFVSTGTVDTPEQFWWDELAGILLERRAVPATLAVSQGARSRTWTTRSFGERENAYRELVPLLTAAEPGLRGDLLGQLRSWGGETPAQNGINRSLTLEELRRLAASPCATVGAHTVNHCQLSSLPASAQREEIVTSKRQLEGWLGREITVFSYPYGRRCHYTKETVALCREAGFNRVAANFPGGAHRWTDPFQVPRHLVRNWGSEEFKARLRGFWTR